MTEPAVTGAVAPVAASMTASCDGPPDLYVTELTEVAAHHAAAALLARVWRVPGGQDVLDASAIRAFAYTGNYVAGAYLGEELVGVTAGFHAADGHLHSHIAGVSPEHQGTGVGLALKRHQRDWALARGIATVSWTFDPLVRRNAYFNLHRLGALAVAYLPAFYGPMTDGINAGDVGDRLLARWDLAAERAVVAATQRLPPPPADGAHLLLGRAGVAPAPPAELPPTAGALLVAVPEDIEGLRATSPDLARRWRDATRAALTGALGAGFQITGLCREGFYRLEKACD